jgi:serine/threonine protein kinase
VTDDTLPTPAPDVPPVIAGRYELGPVIGRGGTADVHRARDLRLQRDVAVKLFTRGVTGSDRQRQDTELATLARLRHPGLIELFDAGTEDGRTYLVMQLVTGPPLAERLQAGPLPEQVVVGFGAELADTLAYVHSHGITHRDVKPANVLLGEDDRPMLGDFGIARLVDTTRVTAAGYLVGTAAYMSPEQVRGGHVGPATDVYALGLVLLECLTGNREYPGAIMESLTARLHRPPDVPPGLAGGLTPLLTRMTATDPAERPTAADVAASLRSPGGDTAPLPAPPVDGATALLDALSPRVVPSAAPPPTALLDAPPRSWQRRVVPTIVGVLFAASGAAFLWSVLAPGDDPTPPPVRPSQVAPPIPTEIEEPVPEPELTLTPELEPVPPPPPATPVPTYAPELPLPLPLPLPLFAPELTTP